MRIADGAAGYGELALRGTVTMVDFWGSIGGAGRWEGRRGCVEGRKEGRAIVYGCIGRRGEGREGERDRFWPMTNVRDGWLCGEPCEQRS